MHPPHLGVRGDTQSICSSSQRCFCEGKHPENHRVPPHLDLLWCASRHPGPPLHQRHSLRQSYLSTLRISLCEYFMLCYTLNCLSHSAVFSPLCGKQAVALQQHLVPPSRTERRRDHDRVMSPAAQLKKRPSGHKQAVFAEAWLHADLL